MKYNFNKETNRIGTYCTQWDYTKDRFGHDDVLPFSISDMDFALPPEFVEYLQEQLQDGIYGYTRWRNDLLRGAIIDWYQRRFDTEINQEMIMYSPTVIYALSEIMRMKTKASDKVMLLTPAYDAFFNVILENDCEIVTSELQNNKGVYEIDQVDFEQKIQGVKVLVMCSPHNPVGKFWSAEELAYIIKVCKEHNVYIISDEIHMDISYGVKHQPIFKIARKLDYAQDVCIITSATKAFNFPGLLFSYVLFENEADRNTFERALKNKNGLSSCTILGMKATAYVYNHLEEWLDQLNAYVYENYQYVANFIIDNNLKMELTKQDGTYLVWINAQEYEMERLLQIMYDEAKLGIMSGAVYGVDGYLRINIGCQRSKLVEGLKRLKQAVIIYEKRRSEDELN